jgi:hypothetical protein
VRRNANDRREDLDGRQAMETTIGTDTEGAIRRRAIRRLIADRSSAGSDTNLAANQTPAQAAMSTTAM